VLVSSDTGANEGFKGAELACIFLEHPNDQGEGIVRQDLDGDATETLRYLGVPAKKLQ
jgi:hypothetical protein